MKNSIRIIIILTSLIISVSSFAQVVIEKNNTDQFQFSSSGKLIYNKDSLGNRLIDFSHVGYHGGEKEIPLVETRLTIESIPGDNTQHIQNAIDELATYQINEQGFRGALLLKKGNYRIEGKLKINQSGIVLRGEGDSSSGTVLIAAGYDDDRYTRDLLTIGNNNSINKIKSSVQEIVDDYVPVGATSFKIESTDSYKPGYRIIVFRPATKEWIHSIGCDRLEPKWRKIRDIRWVKDGDAPGFYYKRLNYFGEYFILKKDGEDWDEFKNRIHLSDSGDELNITVQWTPEDYHFNFERTITSIDGNQVTIDAPVVHSMSKKFGGGAIYHYQTENRIKEVGVENLFLVSEFGPGSKEHPFGPPDMTVSSELHAHSGIVINTNTENTWVRNVSGNYFLYSLVSAKGNKATIQDCFNLGHASKVAGGRRYSFMVNGQLNLVQRCFTNEGRHEFVTQRKTAGPNVFVDCIGINSKSSAGPHHRYSIGTLFDNVKSEKKMESKFRGNSGTGHGWAGTQTCFYNCIAPNFDVGAPPGGISWVLGSGKKFDPQQRLKPQSLYYQQVLDRLGEATLHRLVSPKQLEEIGQFNWANTTIVENKF
jgi:hypothetical protein